MIDNKNEKIVGVSSDLLHELSAHISDCYTYLKAENIKLSKKDLRKAIWVISKIMIETELWEKDYFEEINKGKDK